MICSSPTCTDISYANNNLTFNVSGFSTYVSASNSELEINVSNGYNNKPLGNETIWFLANYTNRSSGISINTTNTNCTIKFNDTSWTNMTFNMSTSLYQHNRSFTRTGTWNYNISCTGSVEGYEDINVTDSLTVYLNATYLVLNQSLVGVDHSSLVLGDIDNDGYDDLIIAGWNGSYLGLVYNNNVSSFVLNSSESITEIIRGSLGLVDYDEDEDSDLVIMGKDENSVLIAKIYKNE